MDLVLELPVKWKMINLCAIAIALALAAPQSSGFSLPAAVEASSLTPPIEAQVLTPEPGPLLNGSTLQPHVKSRLRDLPPPLAAETPHGQPHVSNPPATEAEPSQDSTPPTAAEPPHDFTLPLVAKPPAAVSPLPVVQPPQPSPLAAGTPHEQPHVSTPPPAAELLHDRTPAAAAEPPHDSTLPLAAKPPEAVPPMPFAEPPKPSPLAAETPHVTTPPPTAEAEASHDPTPAAAAEPPHPHDLTPPLAAKPPKAMSPMPTVEPPRPPPLAAETPQEQPHVSTPPPAAEAEPLRYTTPPADAEPPHDSTLPLAAKPPEAVSPMPVTEPPQSLALPPPPKGQPVLPSSPPAEVSQASVEPSPPIPENASAPHQPQTVPKHASSPSSLVPSHGLTPPPLMLPLPLDPLLPLPSPSPAEPPHELSPIPLLVPPHGSPPTFSVPPPLAMPPHSLLPPPPIELPRVFPPPLAMPPHSLLPPPPIELPRVFPPPLAMPPHSLPSPPAIELPRVFPPSYEIPGATPPPYASSPPPLIMSPLAPPPSVIPSRALYAPPPSEASHSSASPSPAMQRTVPADPPHAPPGKEVHIRASPPVPDSPEPSTPRISPPSAPPVSQATSETNPPISHQIEAPKHSAPFFMRSNVSERHAPPLSASVPLAAPPSRAPVQLSPAAKTSPHGSHFNKTPSEPRQDKTAPAPLSFPLPPPTGGSHVTSHHSPVKGPPVAEAPPPSTSEIPEISHAPSPTPRHSSAHLGIVYLSPKFSPSGSSTRNTTRPVAPPILSLPPPPPNQDCAYLTCPEPFTNTPSGSPCGCVWPMQVGLRLSMALYTFFPLVSELAREIAAGVLMKQSQVRVMGAKAATQEPEKTIVLVDLVPLHAKFDNVTASLTFQRFWHKQVQIDKPIFGDYDVLYVNYPGLPPSPPMAPADIAVISSMPYSIGVNNGSILHPLGVVLPEKRHKDRFNGSLVAIIVFSAIVGVLICLSAAWVLILRYTNHNPPRALTLRAQHSLGRSSGPIGRSTGRGLSSPLSLGSSFAKYPGSAKTFSVSEIENATDNFNPSRIVGEGGFGCVYSGTLENGTNIAVKVLKRDDQQGSREFMAEVELLSRIHHRNLVKLIGICIDDHMRCLVYELVPNGSVESHLHGADKDTCPLDWSSRLRIALGAARALAYLHEDSSPGVIHRDFKSSNILLEDDFTPKVSDFGLARAAMDEKNRQISTHIMGTFGYVAPEYAMTGHLLAKSDVYSYGVVLLELLTGRKPVDMLRPAGQESLVAWARPHLTSKEGLESIMDPSLQSADMCLDSMAKVAAIASMCVQPEVSHRPFMGEVVQALKLVCDECDHSKDGNSRSCSPRKLSVDFDAKMAALLDETPDPLQAQLSLQSYLSGFDVEKGFPRPNIFSMSAGFDRQRSSPFRRLSASGPIRNARGFRVWHSIRKLSQGSLSERGLVYRLWAGSH